MLFSTLLHSIDRPTENWLLHAEPKGRGKLIAYKRFLEDMIRLMETTPPELLESVVGAEEGSEVFSQILAKVRQTTQNIETAIQAV